MAAALLCTSWPRYEDAKARCQQPGCGWKAAGPSPAEVAEAARTHTTETGHPTQSEHVQVTEYRHAGTLPLTALEDVDAAA